MKNLKKRISNKVFYVATLFVAVFAVGSVVAFAFSGNNSGTVFEGDCNNCTLEAPESEVPLVDFSAQPSPDIFVDSIAYGSGLSVRLKFGPGVTSTPGGSGAILFLRNSVCTNVVLNIHTVDNTGGEFGKGSHLAWSVGTSTSPSGDYGFSDLPGIIATTTVATGTQALLSYVSNPGANAVWSANSPSTTPFRVTAGEHILATFETVDASGVLAVASSTAYDGYAGTLFADCYLEN